MNSSTFFATLRPEIGPFTKPQVDGFNRILAEALKRGTALSHLAAIIATTWWETGKTMQPVREAFYIGDFAKAEAWRKKNLRYYPYYGRGDVQLTHDFNYSKATEYFNKVLGIAVDFVKNPDLVMRPEYSVIILFQGMTDGWFTTKKLDDYIDGIDEPDSEDLREFINSRRVVNGTDKAATIGGLALKFENALRVAGWGLSPPPPPPDVPKGDPDDDWDATAPVPTPAKTPKTPLVLFILTALAAIGGAIAKHFGLF